MEKSSVLDQVSSLETECEHPSAGFHASVWGGHFLSYAFQSRPEFEESALQQKIQELKNEVKKILVEATSNDKPIELLFLIDDIQHLGIDYHFEKEIGEALQCLYQRSCKSSDVASDTNDSLHATAVMFVLLRRKGCNVPCRIFEKFKAPDGQFEESIKNDTRGLLSLYEATHFRCHGDHILEEALPFTLAHLASVKEHLSPLMKYEMSRALKGHGTRVRFARLEAYHFIKNYQDEPSHNQVLLELAKLDFNLLQEQHQRELCELTRWWSCLEVKKNFPFARDRLVEVYFWSLIAYQQECTSYRIIFTKVICMLTIVDDMFDTHGTLDELEVLANAIERWDMKLIDELPANYMKVFYKALLDVYDEIEQMFPMEARSYGKYFGIKSVKDLVRVYHTEAKWQHQRNIPTLEEYMEVVGYVSGGAVAMFVPAFLGMIDIATKEALEWLFSTSKIVRASEIVFRILNDVTGYERDIKQKLGQIKTVECYMKQHHVTVEEAKKDLHKVINEAWKTLNDEFLALTSTNVIPATLLSLLVDITRMMVLWHEEIDIYTNPTTTMKDAIAAVLINPFPIDIECHNDDISRQ